MVPFDMVRVGTSFAVTINSDLVHVPTMTAAVLFEHHFGISNRSPVSRQLSARSATPSLRVFISRKQESAIRLRGR
ncbi:hypothetical protein ABIC60_004859 [Phyllobacterium ifriqiyense]